MILNPLDFIFISVHSRRIIHYFCNVSFPGLGPKDYIRNKWLPCDPTRRRSLSSSPCSLDDLCPIGTTRTRSWGGCRSRHNKGWPSWLKSNQVFCLDMGYLLRDRLQKMKPNLLREVEKIILLPRECTMDTRIHSWKKTDLLSSQLWPNQTLCWSGMWDATCATTAAG